MTGPDVVIVGSGPAGCAAAARLLDQGRRVALFEAGPGPDRPPAVSSLDALIAVHAPGWTWPDVQWSSETPARRAVGGPYALGRGISGGAAVNAMVLTIGDRAQYDDWARRAADPGWSWSSIEPGYQELCRRLPTMNVESGPLGAAVAAAFDAATGEAGAGSGAARPSSLIPDGRGPLAATVAAGPDGRASLVDALLRAEPGGDLHPGLELRPGQAVRRVIVGFDGAVVGVETDDGTRVAAPTVVLCAGALRSPELAASAQSPRGMGPPSATDAIPMMDHPSFAFAVTLRPAARLDDTPRPPVSVVLRCGIDGGLGGERADVLIHVLDHVGPGPDGRRYGAVVVALATPTSIGSMPSPDIDGLAGDGTASPGLAIRPGWLTDAADGAAMVGAVRLVGSWLAGPEVGSVAELIAIDEDGTEAAAIDGWTDDELLGWLRGHPGPVRHPTSTLSPLLTDRSPGPTNAGSDEARGLVIADGSVLPEVPAANPQLPIMANAWRLMAEI